MFLSPRNLSKQTSSLLKLAQRIALPSTHSISHFSTSLARKQQEALIKDPLANFPGCQAPYTTTLEFKKSDKPIPIFHILDTEGNVINEEQFNAVIKDFSNEKLVSIYKEMIFLEAMDDVLLNAQRQGRVSFYMTNYGEEAVQIGSAEALHPNDEIFAQYREAGVLVHRGFTLDEILHQCFATIHDYGKGRQMPVHYGSKKLHFQTISSPLATQIPQAAGAGYAYRISGQHQVCACYFGEGAASEGDFHAALNFAATLHCQTIFICRNNGYAISTPTKDQYAGDGIAARGVGYGMHTIRVDGNDFFAVYRAVQQARELSIENKMPVLVEAMTYRAGHHSTSDDSTRYRSAEELDFWRKKQNPVIRFRQFLTKRGLWTEEAETKQREEDRKYILDRVNTIEKVEKTGLDELVTDVYDEVPTHLQEQKAFVDQMVNKYPEHYHESHH